jgi:hypothetical protein
MRISLFTALLIVAGATSASAAAPAPPTVNFYTPQQMAHAKALVAKAGRHVVATENVQDGNFFFVAVGNGMAYLCTVTSSGEVYFGNGLPVPHSFPVPDSVPIS